MNSSKLLVLILILFGCTNSHPDKIYPYLKDKPKSIIDYINTYDKEFLTLQIPPEWIHYANTGYCGYYRGVSFDSSTYQMEVDILIENSIIYEKVNLIDSQSFYKSPRQKAFEWNNSVVPNLSLELPILQEQFVVNQTHTYILESVREDCFDEDSFNSLPIEVQEEILLNESGYTFGAFSDLSQEYSIIYWLIIW